jgi:hypothetical protein
MFSGNIFLFSYLRIFHWQGSALFSQQGMHSPVPSVYWKSLCKNNSPHAGHFIPVTTFSEELVVIPCLVRPKLIARRENDRLFGKAVIFTLLKAPNALLLSDSGSSGCAGFIPECAFFFP